MIPWNEFGLNILYLSYICGKTEKPQKGNWPGLDSNPGPLDERHYLPATAVIKLSIMVAMLLMLSNNIHSHK